MKRKATVRSTQPKKRTKVETIPVVVPEPIEHAEVCSVLLQILIRQILAFGGGDASQLTDQYDTENKQPRPVKYFKDVTLVDVSFTHPCQTRDFLSSTPCSKLWLTGSIFWLPLSSSHPRQRKEQERLVDLGCQR